MKVADMLVTSEEFSLNSSVLKRDETIVLKSFIDSSVSINNILNSYVKDGFYLVPKDSVLEVYGVVWLLVIEDSNDEVVKFEVVQQNTDNNKVAKGERMGVYIKCTFESEEI